MSGIPKNQPSLGPTTQPGLKLPVADPRPVSAALPGSGTGDRLATAAGAARRPSEPDPSTLAARVRQLRDPQIPAREQPSPAAAESNRGGLFSGVSNLAISFMTSPRFTIKRVEGLLSSSPRLIKGGHRAKQLAVDLKEAIDEGRPGRFIQGNARILRLSAAARKQAAIQVIRRGRLQDLLKVISRSKPSGVINLGMVRNYQLARQAGSAPLRAAARAFSKTVETSGDVPQITAEATRLGGRLGRALTWAGRVGRVAPLLNVPLAVFDVSSAVKSLRNPRASTRERVSSTGRAALTTVAAGLAVAGFVTPPPINLTLLGVAAGVGLGSTLWSVATGATASRLAGRTRHAVASAARWLGF